MDSSKDLLKELTEHYRSHQVSVLVGSGFSRNAYPNFPLWDGLLYDLMIELYGTEIKESYEVYQHTQRPPFTVLYPSFEKDQLKRISDEKGYLRIVSDYIRKKGNRESMDVYIEKHIPYLNEENGTLQMNLDPSFSFETKNLEVHAELLKCNWLDVYTTNYDNLLEKAADEWNYPYNLVTSDYDLGNNNDSRNIIKLHGNLVKDSVNDDFIFDNDNSLRYIIAQEDYDSYPVKHEAFTQLMRIAMLKGVFLLLGFSGNDPNFLAWLNWMKDVLDKDPNKKENKSIKVFLLVLSKSSLTTEQELYFKNHRIGIICLDDVDLLSEITGVNNPPDGFSLSIAERFIHLFEYLRNAEKKASFKGYEKDKYSKLWSRVDSLLQKPDELAPVEEELYSFSAFRILDKTFWQERILDAIYNKPWDEIQSKVINVILRDMPLLSALMFEECHNEVAKSLENWKMAEALMSLAYNIYTPVADATLDNDIYNNLLYYAYNLDIKNLHTLLASWTPTDRFVQNWASFSAYSDSKNAVDKLDKYIASADESQERYLASTLRNYIEYQIPARYTYYEYEDIPGFFSIRDYLLQEIRKSNDSIKPHGWVGSVYNFGNDVAKIRGGIKFLELLMKSGFLISYKSMSIVNCKDWYYVFKQIFELFPYPALFYSLTTTDKSISTCIGQDFAYSEKLHKVLPDMLMKLLNCIDEDTIYGYRDSYWIIAREIAIAVKPDVWLDVFIEILDKRLLPSIKAFTFSTEPYKFTKQLVGFINEGEQQERIFKIFIRHAHIDPIAIGDILLRLNKKFEANQDTINQLSSVFENYPITKTHYLAASLIDNDQLINAFAPIISKKIVAEEIKTGRSDRFSTLHTLTYLSNKEQDSILIIKSEILSEDIWCCGITGPSSGTNVNYLNLNRISKDIKWELEDLKTIAKNIDKNLTLLETAKLHDGWFANDYVNLVDAMRVFIASNSDTEEKKAVFDISEQRCVNLLAKLLDGNDFYQALSSDDHTRISIYGNNLLMSIERDGFAKYQSEIIMCLVRALFPDQKCLRYILSMVSYLAEKYNAEMSSPNILEMTLSILDKYSKYDFVDSEEALPYIYSLLKEIARSFENLADQRQSVKYWLTDEMANRFNV